MVEVQIIAGCDANLKVFASGSIKFPCFLKGRNHLRAVINHVINLLGAQNEHHTPPTHPQMPAVWAVLLDTCFGSQDDPRRQRRAAAVLAPGPHAHTAQHTRRRRAQFIWSLTTRVSRSATIHGSPAVSTIDCTNHRPARLPSIDRRGVYQSTSLSVYDSSVYE